MNPLQKAAFRRKVYYFAAILVLFTVSMLWRGIIPIPLSDLARAPANAAQRGANWLAGKSILNQSYALDLRELEQGEPEIAGEGMRLALTGSRGFAVAYLWHSAIEAQKRNDFHKMETLITQVTRLQPHFITPWIFQSWNIAYNVSVEMHGSGDMYFYIARGIELLAEGERRNSHTVRDPAGGERKLGSPDIRYQIAFYYQNKFGVSDQVEVLRCLFQLSCMPPDDRNPDNLLDETGQVDLRKFQAFCEKYPHLVRRLRGEERGATGIDARAQQRIQEALKCPEPIDIVRFLRDNREIPTRYKSARELADPDKQFPALPPRFNDEEAHPGMVLEDDFTAFKAARAWFVYACVPLPPNPLDRENKPLPWRTPTPDEYNQLIYRVPRQPLLIIFRQGPPRVQSYQAELEQKEGWFDDKGWQIDDPSGEPRYWWFPDPSVPPGGTPRPLSVVVGTKRPWSRQEWEKAAAMWRHHGEVYGLELTESRYKRYESIAKQGPGGNVPLNPTPELLNSEWYQAASALQYYQQNRSVTNFPYFLAAAEAEQLPATVQARKTLWQAEQARKLGKKTLATRLYLDGLNQWKAVLAANKAFHRPERSDRTDEQTYEYELAYLRMLVQDDERVREKANEVVAPCRAVIPFLPYPYMQTLRQTQLAENEKVLALPWYLRRITPLPYPPPLTPEQRLANQVAARIRTIFPSFEEPFVNEDDPPEDIPQWDKDAREEIKWFVAEKFFSPFAGVMDVDDDRKGGPWVRNEIKQSVRVAQGIQRRTPQPQEPPPGAAQVQPPQGTGN
jgi:hypothetical protein